MSALLEARHLSRILVEEPPVVLVDDASLAFVPGSFTAIVGPSGCGKSSLLYLLGLLDRPTGGSLLLRGEEVGDLDGDDRARLRLEQFGFVFQFHFLLPEFSALENVMLPIRKLGRLDHRAARDRAFDLLLSLGLAEKADKTPNRMSGGERQRVAIARALANDPALILCDEPTGNLDSENGARVVETFRQLAHREARAVICVTHDLGIAAAADVRVSLLDGHIVEIARQADAEVPVPLLQ
jgi:lipoprotein-releasing system ATP-binding protein